MSIERPKIDRSILLASNATVVDAFDLHSDAAISKWSIGRNAVTYEKGDSHTLSLYLSGGETSYRADNTGTRGAPGRICLMPQGHQSKWHINGTIDFLHLYFSDHLLKTFAAQHFDKDVRFIEMPDLTYNDDPVLQAKLLAYVRACERAPEHAFLASEAAFYDLMYHLITRYNSFAVKGEKIQGGLSPSHIRAVKARINDDLSSGVTIADLAHSVTMSPYHFARMFKISFGVAPAAYVNQIRLARAKGMLVGDLSIADISAVTGFTHQSHMTQSFKKHFGITPKQYRSLMAA
jgi:AraC family transcriptional regulator